MAAGIRLTSGMTAGSSPSRTAWQNDVACGWVTPSRMNGNADSTTSRCWVVPSRRLRKATLRPSDSFAVTSRSAICWSAAERFLRMGCLLSSCPVIDRPGRELERPHSQGEEGRTQPRRWLRRTTPVERYRAHEHPVVRPRPGADLEGSDAGREHRRQRRAGPARRAIRLPPGLVRRAPQHAGDRLLGDQRADRTRRDRKSTRLNSSHANISYAVFCLKKKKILT